MTARSSLRVAVIALLCAVPAHPARAAAASPAPEVVRLEDGLEVVTWPQPGAKRAALWVVVRAGATSDPAGRAGLAHLVEHLAFAGSHDVEGRAFFDEARAAGARVNAHTYPERITFELDAPAAKLDALGARFLALVTSPAWKDAPIGRERGVIDTEATYHSAEGLLSLVDMAIFPASRQGAPIIGTSESRAQLEPADAAAFFSRHMVPSNMTVVLAGAVTPEQARALVDRAFRIPPARAGEGASLPVDVPTLPMEQKVPAGLIVTLLGYELDPADRPLCRAVSTLLELRLKLGLQLAKERVSEVSVGCHRLRGHDFLVAFAYSNTLDVGYLPQRLQAVIGGLATSPPSAEERSIVQGRLARQLARAQADPVEAAGRVAALAAERAGQDLDLSALRAAPLPGAGRLGELVRRSFAPARQVLLNLSPAQD
jgi:predicted Zn-dependent peptidase